MVALNSGFDSDWMSEIRRIILAETEAGRSVRVVPVEVTYSPVEVARMVGVSKMTVLRRIQDGSITASRRGAYWRIPEREIDKLSHLLVAPMMQAIADELDP